MQIKSKDITACSGDIDHYEVTSVLLTKELNQQFLFIVQCIMDNDADKVRELLFRLYRQTTI